MIISAEKFVFARKFTRLVSYSLTWITIKNANWYTENADHIALILYLPRTRTFTRAFPKFRQDTNNGYYKYQF